MKISDSHTDFLTAIESIKQREQHVKQIKSFGAKTISCAVFTTEKQLDVKDIINYSDELERYKQKYNINLLLSIEDMGFSKDEKQLNQLIALKPFSVGLTWNYANQFGGGAYSKNGLSNLGKQYVKILEENNIWIDSAHMSRKSFYDFCKITRYPIYNSHSNIYTLKHHRRNLTDKQIDYIVKSNGYLGITLYDKFISNKNISSKDLANQFDYLIKRWGFKNFGLGTDFYGINKNNLPIDIQNYKQLNNLIIELSKLGYGKYIIDQIMFKNFETFYITFKSSN